MTAADRSAAARLLLEARRSAVMTQAELATRAGIPQTMVSAYELDKRQPTLATLLRLLKAAGFELHLHLAPDAAALAAGGTPHAGGNRNERLSPPGAEVGAGRIGPSNGPRPGNGPRPSGAPTAVDRPSRALVGGAREGAADQRNEAGEQRDEAGDQRDQAAQQRDEAGDQRDQAAEERDQTAEERDQTAEQREASVIVGISSDAIDRSALARREAASDRQRALQDRRAGASERTQAELDRSTALADRGASARERENASTDDLTGVYVRGAGFAELEREIVRARRTGQPLVVAFVDVDRLKAINDAHGHAAGDRMLLAVATTLGAYLRSYDLIIRYGGDEFVCAMAGLNLDDAMQRLSLVNTALADAADHGSVTVGLAELRADDSPEGLVARADAALYELRQRQREP